MSCLCVLPDWVLSWFQKGQQTAAALHAIVQQGVTLASLHTYSLKGWPSLCPTSAAHREVAACLRGPVCAGLWTVKPGNWARSSFIRRLSRGTQVGNNAATQTSQPWLDLCNCMTLWLEWSHLSATTPPSSALRINRIWKRTVRPSMPAPTSGSAASMLALVTPGVLRVTKRRPRGLATCTARQAVAGAGRCPAVLLHRTGTQLAPGAQQAAAPGP